MTVIGHSSLICDFITFITWHHSRSNSSEVILCFTESSLHVEANYPFRNQPSILFLPVTASLFICCRNVTAAIKRKLTLSEKSVAVRMLLKRKVLVALNVLLTARALSMKD